MLLRLSAALRALGGASRDRRLRMLYQDKTLGRFACGRSRSVSVFRRPCIPLGCAKHNPSASSCAVLQSTSRLDRPVSRPYQADRYCLAVCRALLTEAQKIGQRSEVQAEGPFGPSPDRGNESPPVWNRLGDDAFVECLPEAKAQMGRRPEWGSRPGCSDIDAVCVMIYWMKLYASAGCHPRFPTTRWCTVA
ncbi:hypothetical protein PYCCODRAFT_218067 [Trametes coccinea BRFM310]|uniref:Uncharacterized protein n=1 Tax=Trametes coccinea (strain BRFM310) TaxID=1353009 RepID=A0A1Y2IS54_TRAC3|nr:hypothetical protein PYCCODRAFT_218067 [Trametes coccinea BRFM310]